VYLVRLLLLHTLGPLIRIVREMARLTHIHGSLLTSNLKELTEQRRLQRWEKVRGIHPESPRKGKRRRKGRLGGEVGAAGPAGLREAIPVRKELRALAVNDWAISYSFSAYVLAPQGGMA
jgi:hypothetical protein